MAILTNHLDTGTTKFSHQGITGEANGRSYIWLAVFAMIAAIRIEHHAMFRDELQAWMIAVSSASLIDLFQNLRYEGHPGLWHLLLWSASRLSSNPDWMKAINWMIVVGYLYLIWIRAPFGFWGKFLISLSYYFFSEFTEISRNYAIGALLLFLFVSRKGYERPRELEPWLILGLAANANVFCALATIAFAGQLAYQDRRSLLLGPGAWTYCLLLVIAIFTMIQGLLGSDSPRVSEPHPWNSDFVLKLGAILQQGFLGISSFPSSLLNTAFQSISPGGTFSSLSNLTGKLADFPSLFILAVISLAPYWRPTLFFAASSLGMLTIYQLYGPVSSRHVSIIFISYLCAMWMVASQVRPNIWRAASFYLLVWINAICGLRAIVAELHPYSQAKNAATWIVEHGLRNETWIGTPDYSASAVAGYLRRPIYYAECNCVGTYVRWSSRRHEISYEEFDLLLTRFAAEQNEIYVIIDEPHDFFATNPSFSVMLLAQFTGATMLDENYYLYQVKSR